MRSLSSRLLKLGVITRIEFLVTRRERHGPAFALFRTAGYRPGQLAGYVVRAGDEPHRGAEAESGRGPDEVQARNGRLARPRKVPGTRSA